MIQDIKGRYDNTYIACSPEGEDRLLIYRDFGVLVRSGAGGIVFPLCGDLGDAADGGNIRYLFSIDGIKYFGFLTERESGSDGYEYLDLRSLFGCPADNELFAAVTGMQLVNWYRNRKYCGRCGAPLRPGEEERTLVCGQCGRTEYPQISPAVIVGITDGDRIVLTRYAEGYSKAALVAGFCEIGESFEDTVRREAMEEVGLRVKNITYYGSQPWSYSDSMLAGFFCEVDGDRTITVDGKEIGFAGWFKKEDVPERKDGMSLTGEMMNYFKNNEVELKER